MNVGRLLHISLQLGQFLRLGIQATEPCPTRTQLYSPFSWALLQARLSRQAGHVQPQVFHTQCWAGSQADHSRQPDHDQPQLYNGVQLCRGLFHINCAIGPRLVHNIMHRQQHELAIHNTLPHFESLLFRGLSGISVKAKAPRELLCGPVLCWLAAIYCGNRAPILQSQVPALP